MSSRILPLIACVFLWTPSLNAQEWRVEARAGLYPESAGPVGGDVFGAALGLQYSRPEFWTSALLGVPSGDEGNLWGGVSSGVDLWTPGSRWAIGLQASGQLFGQRQPGALIEEPTGPNRPGRAPVFTEPPGTASGGVQPTLTGHGYLLQVTPGIRFQASRTSVSVNGGASQYTAAFADQQFSRTLGVAGASYTFTPRPNVRLSSETRAYFATEATYPYAGVEALYVHRRGRVWGRAGRWLAENIPTVPWSLGGGLNVGSRTALTVSVRQDAFDPLIQTPSRTAWNFGVSVRLGPPAFEISVPEPDSYKAGVATLSLPASSGQKGTPSIGGDFNGWQPVPMTREGDRWVHRISVSPGLYNYAFVASDGTWFVPESTPGRKPDGFGGFTATLVIR